MNVLQIIENKKLDISEKKLLLEDFSSSLIHSYQLGNSVCSLLNNSVICCTDENANPWAPRSIFPDYAYYLKKGSSFLHMPPAKDLYDAVGNLIILYHEIISYTGVLENICYVAQLLEPYINTVSENEKDRLLVFLFTKTFKNRNNILTSFSLNGMNNETEQRIIDIFLNKNIENVMIQMHVSKETLKKNISEVSKYALQQNKVCFISDQKNKKNIRACDIVSPYSGKNFIGGCCLTKITINFDIMAKKAISFESFFSIDIPIVMQSVFDLITYRIKFIISKSHLYKTLFLFKERSLDTNLCTAVIEFYALDECLNIFDIKNESYLEKIDRARRIINACMNFINEKKTITVDDTFRVTLMTHLKYNTAMLLEKRLITTTDTLPFLSEIASIGSIHKAVDSAQEELFLCANSSLDNDIDDVTSMIQESFKLGIKAIQPCSQLIPFTQNIVSSKYLKSSCDYEDENEVNNTIFDDDKKRDSFFVERSSRPVR